jgi:phosphoglycerate dehydrogenase-like enzyme
MRGLELAGKVVGIVGFGAIGSEVARRLRAFDMAVLVYDPYLGREEITKAGARQVELHALMKESDFITLHCPVSTETAGLIGAEEISLMKPAAYLINTAGWEIVDEAALFQALAERRIAGAAFDVYQTHPVSPDSQLLRLDNVLLTPHIGGATEGTVTRYSRMMVEDIIRFLDGKRPKNLVNAEAWQHYVR